MTDHTKRAEIEARQMRSDVFAALRRHDASDDLFAEIAAITHHYIAALPLAPLAQRGMTEQEIEALAKECVGSVKGLYFDSSSCQHSHRAFQSARLVSRATLSRVPVAGWPGEAELREMAEDCSRSPAGRYLHPINAALEMARRLRAHMTGGDFFAESAKKSARITDGEQQTVAAAMTDGGLA